MSVRYALNPQLLRMNAVKPQRIRIIQKRHEGKKADELKQLRDAQQTYHY